MPPDVHPRLKQKETVAKLREEHRLILGSVSNELGPCEASRLFNVSKSVAIYWKKKYLDPDFHNGEHGGARNCPFSDEQIFAICSVISHIAHTKPTSRLCIYKKRIAVELGLGVSISFIRSVFKAAGWTYALGTPPLDAGF
jgi:transposase